MKVFPILKTNFVQNRVSLLKSVVEPKVSTAVNEVHRISSEHVLNKNFSKDVEYKKQLLDNIGIDNNAYYKIRSILGGGEIKSFLLKHSNSPQTYTTGLDLQNVKAGIYGANLHIHTINSDGLFTTQELLDIAAEYGDNAAKINKRHEPFVIAITDHDTTEGIEEATKIILKNPEKYKNIRVIMGAEITTFDNIEPEILDYPTNAHILVYGINPQEAKFKEFIENTKKIKFKIAKKMFIDADLLYQRIYEKKSDFSIEEAKQFSTQFRESVTGMFNHVDRYIKTKFILDEIVLKEQELKNALNKNMQPNELMSELSRYYKPINRNNYAQTPQQLVQEFIGAKTSLDKEKISEIFDKELKNEKIQKFFDSLDLQFQQYKISLNPKYRYIPNFEMLKAALVNQPNALVGIAHPLDYIKRIENSNDSFKFLYGLYLKFKEVFKEKALFCETYYQSYSAKVKQYSENPEMAEFIKQLADRYKYYNTGGIDNHRKNLFSRY